jgi:hypothetical protein
MCNPPERRDLFGKNDTVYFRQKNEIKIFHFKNLGLISSLTVEVHRR